MKRKDLFTWKEESFTLKSLAGDITSAMNKKITKCAARVIEDEKIVSRFAIGEARDEVLWQQCGDQWSGAMPFLATLPEIEEGSFEHRGPVVSEEEFERKVADVIAEFVKKYPYFIPQGQFDLKTSVRRYALDGKVKSSRYSYVESSLFFKHKDSASIIDHGLYLKGDTGLDLNQFLSLQEQFLSKWNTEVPVTAGKKNVCFYGDNAGVFGKIKESLGPELYHSGSALFSGTAGKELFHRSLSIFDRAIDPVNGSFSPFDDEGVSTVGTHPLIREGVFMGPIYDLRNAKKFGTRSTGHGIRGGVPNGTIGPAPFFFSPGPGKKSIAELLGELGETVVVLMMGGGDNTPEGEFSSPVMTSFLVKDGKVLGRLPQLTIRGNIKRFLGEDFLGTSSEAPGTGIDPVLFTKLDVFVN